MGALKKAIASDLISVLMPFNVPVSTINWAVEQMLKKKPAGGVPARTIAQQLAENQDIVVNGASTTLSLCWMHAADPKIPTMYSAALALADGGRHHLAAIVAEKCIGYADTGFEQLHGLSPEWRLALLRLSLQEWSKVGDRGEIERLQLEVEYAAQSVAVNLLRAH